MMNGQQCSNYMSAGSAEFSVIPVRFMSVISAPKKQSKLVKQYAASLKSASVFCNHAR
jgi:hypothetical protein